MVNKKTGKVLAYILTLAMIISLVTYIPSEA